MSKYVVTKVLDIFLLKFISEMCVEQKKNSIQTTDGASNVDSSFTVEFFVRSKVNALDVQSLRRLN